MLQATLLFVLVSGIERFDTLDTKRVAAESLR